MNGFTDIQEILNYSKLMYKHPWNNSKNFYKDSSSRTGDVTDSLLSGRKWGNEQTDRHIRNVKLLSSTEQTS